MGKINNFLLRFTSYFLKMSRGKSRTSWHFRVHKFQNFLGQHAPHTLLVVSASGASKMSSRAYILKIPRYAPEPHAIDDRQPSLALSPILLSFQTIAEGAGYDSRRTSKAITKLLQFVLERSRPCTIFCFTLTRLVE